MFNNEMSKYSGEEFYRKPPRLEYDEIRLKGNLGHFVRVKKVGDNYEESIEGEQLKGVIIKVRRRLVDFKNKLSTSEHNHPNDEVTLFKEGGFEKSIARELREKYQSLKTNQVLYVMLPTEEIVRVIVRGASLGSENKPKESIPFYQYLSSFGNDEHVWEYYTKFAPIKETGKLGDYYAIHFERAEKVDNIESVTLKAKDIYDKIVAIDSYYKKSEKSQVKEELPIVQLDEEKGEEEIDVKNIPF